MINTVNFEQFSAQNADWKDKYNVYQRDHPTYQRIPCIWKETLSDHRILVHEYHAIININSGEIFLDSRKRKILAKHVVLLFARPLHTCVKTLWHLSIICPLAIEFFKYIQGKQTDKNLLKNTFESMTDIVRTPAYGVALTIMHIVAIIFGSLSPNTLYKTSDICGKLEWKLLRIKASTDPGSIWELHPCFSPSQEIQRINRDRKLLDNFARLCINYQRTSRAICNNNCRLLPRNTLYISPAAQ